MAISGLQKKLAAVSSMYFLHPLARLVCALLSRTPTKKSATGVCKRADGFGYFKRGSDGFFKILLVLLASFQPLLQRSVEIIMPIQQKDPEKLAKSNNLVVFHGDSFGFKQLLHAVWMSEVMFAREQANAVLQPAVQERRMLLARGIHGVTNQT